MRELTLSVNGTGVRCEVHRRDTPPLASKDENVRVAHLTGHGLLHVGTYASNSITWTRP
jgi:hypothetical protein